ncbi:hypothetical protein L0O84_02435, partial [Bifidobacterium longum]|nr:hypothetical protein [Bifidobacterium longum]
TIAPWTATIQSAQLFGHYLGQSLISEAAVPAGVPVQRELGDEFVRRFYALVPRSGLTHDQRELAETIIAALRG